jgi:hypothetical protein
MLKDRGFSSRLISIIKTLLDSGSVGLRKNNENSELFFTGRGVRQTDHISPILFNFVADFLTKMLMRAAANNHITALMHNMVRNGVVSMQMLMIPCCSLKTT